MVQTFSSFSADAVTYIAEKTLLIAKKQVIFQQLGDRVSLPSNNSRTFQYTRYDRLALPLTSLTEGVTPSSTDVSISTVSATADQFGAYVNLSDVAQLTVKHPVMVKAIDLMGKQAAETMDRETIQILLAGTNVFLGGGVATRSALSSTTTDVVNTDLIRKVISSLRSYGAHERDGNDFDGVVDPQVEMDISKDSTFQLAASYSNIKVLQNGEIGRWMGSRWMRSNLIPVLSGIAHQVPATPAGGSFAAANYKVSVVYFNKLTGFMEKICANTDVAFAASDKLTITLPSDTNYVYKVFIGLAGGAAADVMYQGLDTVSGSAFLAASAAVEVLAPPVSGASIAGSDIPAVGKAVHFSWVLGKEFYAVIDLQKLQTFVTPQAASDSDPLVQRRKAGWKFNFKALICNQLFGARMESLSAF